MVATFHWFRGEAFGCVVEDVDELAASGARIIAEGFRLLPRLVAPLLRKTDRAVWLLPTPEFRRRALEARGLPWDIAGRTSDPDQALTALLARDALFTDRLRGEVGRLGLQAIVVDGTEGVEQVADRVEDLFGL